MSPLMTIVGLLLLSGAVLPRRRTWVRTGCRFLLLYIAVEVVLVELFLPGVRAVGVWMGVPR